MKNKIKVGSIIKLSEKLYKKSLERGERLKELKLQFHALQNDLICDICNEVGVGIDEYEMILSDQINALFIRKKK